MAAVAKVVSIDHARRSSARGEPQRVLIECREDMIQRLVPLLDKARQPIDDHFMKLAEASHQPARTTLILDTRAAVLKSWGVAMEDFVRAFADEFGEKLANLTGRKAERERPVSVLDLELVEDEALDESIEIGELAKRLRYSCDRELLVLARRVGGLMGRTDLSEENNPLGVATVVTGLRGMAEAICDSVRSKLLMLQTVERFVAAELEALYREINDLLVPYDPGYAGVRRPHPRMLESAVQSTAPPADKNAQPAQTTPGGAPDILALLQRVVTAHLPAEAQAAFAAASTGEVVPLPASVLTALTDLQRTASPFVGAGAAITQGATGFATAPSGVFQPTNLVRMVKTGEIGQQLNRIDSLTVDVVAMLFDYVFDDQDVPDPIKALVGRLQIPILKAAMLDQSFFSNKFHPARRLLDAISRAAIAIEGEIGHNHPLYAKIDYVVTRIQAEFDQSVSLFDELLVELESFLDEQEAGAEQIVEQSAKLVAERERAELAEQSARDALQPVLAAELPSVIREFLSDRWRLVLQRRHLSAGPDSDDWKDALKCVQELIWSIEPKLTAEERKGLVTLLPLLVRRINAGLDQIGLGKPERAPFFDALIELHAAAIKSASSLSARPKRNGANPPSKRAAPGPTQPKACEPSKPAQVVVSRVAEGNVELESVRLTEGRRPTSGFIREANNMKRGDWVQFLQPEGPAVRARLSWVSPQRGILLFTNPQSTRAIAISPEALAHKFEAGLAQFVDPEPMLDRAIQRVLDQGGVMTAPVN